MQTVAASGLTPCHVCLQEKKRGTERRMQPHLLCFSVGMQICAHFHCPTKNTRFPLCSLQGIHMEITRLKTTTAIRGTFTLMWKTTRSTLIIQSHVTIIHWDFKPTQYGLICRINIPHQPLMRNFGPGEASAKHLTCISQLTSDVIHAICLFLCINQQAWCKVYNTGGIIPSMRSITYASYLGQRVKCMNRKRSSVSKTVLVFIACD